MKSAVALYLLTLSANAAVVKRQGHDHGGAPSYGSPAAGGFSIPGLEGFKIPGLENFKLPGLNFAVPKGGFAAMMKPDVRKAYKVEEIPPQKYKDAKRIRITYGPYKVRASSVSL